jgi:hypothetical protein
MNLPGIDTCVCDASVAKDADARVSQICPRLEGRRMSPIDAVDGSSTGT